MRTQQQEHIATVMQVVGGSLAAPLIQSHDKTIRASWQRCVHEYRLDPTQMQEAVILPSGRLREHQDQMEAFIHIARHGLETLYQQVAGMGYCVLLTDARGVTVDFLGDLVFEPSLRKAGLYLGADWSEQHAGTCGVGTCIATGEALTVHLDDHFDATHIPLTCTSAPVYDPFGKLKAVLDISALSSPAEKQSQHLALQLVKMYAAHVENASFLQRFRHDWVLRLSSAPQFLDVSPEYLLALDATGRIIGHNRRAQQLIQGPSHSATLLGTHFDQVFNARLEDIGRFVLTSPSDQRAITLAGNHQLLFMLASPPPSRTLATQTSTPERVIPSPLAALSGGDLVLDRQIERAARLVNSPISLLLTGETGSGKEYFAKALHQSSERRRQPFVAVNCAAIPEALIESELFGHMPGSFSGAGTKGKRGLIQEADGGTLFLDEIGDMPLALQARLLRVLAEREVCPVGAIRPVPVNIRVIAATHADLVTLVRQGRFRDDLYYRLNGAHFTLPPLRERQDLSQMIDRMLQHPADASHVHAGHTLSLSPVVRQRLLQHRWPGNLRELHNVMSYARSLCSGGHIELHDLPDDLAHAPAAPGKLLPPPTDDDGQALRTALRAARWNVTAVARQLQVSRMTLYRRMKRWGIEAPHRVTSDSDLA